MFFNRCGRHNHRHRCGCHHHRRRRCGICGIFDCLCGRRRRCDCFAGGNRFEQNVERSLERSDFDGFFPEAKFVRTSRDCMCKCRCC